MRRPAGRFRAAAASPPASMRRPICCSCAHLRVRDDGRSAGRPRSQSQASRTRAGGHQRDADRPRRRHAEGGQSDSLTGVGDLYPIGLAQVERRQPQLHGLHHGRRAGGRLRRRTASPTSAPTTGRSTRAAATPTSTPRRATSSPRCSASPTTGRTRTPTTRTAPARHLDWAASQFLSEQFHVGAGRLLLPPDERRQRRGRGARRLQVARLRHRPAGRLLLPGGRQEVVREPQGLLRVRREEPAGRLEHLADAGDSARSGRNEYSPCCRDRQRLGMDQRLVRGAA